MLWGLANLSVAYLLLVIVADVAPGPSVRTGIAALGFALASIGIARSVIRVSSA